MGHRCGPGVRALFAAVGAALAACCVYLVGTVLSDIRRPWDR